MKKDKKTIVVVDDDNSVANLIVAIIKRSIKKTTEFETEIFNCPFQALKEIKKNPGKYCAAFFDYTMPRMNGGQLGKKVIRINPDIKIFIITGWSEDFGPKESKESGFSGYIMKPFEVKEIRALILNL